MSASVIYHVLIERFRGIETLSWRPAAGLNVILGGGDVGKTTILDAIGLLLSPANPTTVPDTDYYGRDVEKGFSITAVLALPPGSGISAQSKPSWPWHWNGHEAVVPNTDAEDAAQSEPVYCVRVRGNPDLELAYEILQPDETTDGFPVALRRSIGLVRLGGDDRNDRDLRLVQGSALDRLLSDKGLRSRLASQFAQSKVKSELKTDAAAALTELDQAFKQKSLPDKLDLAITGAQGLSITALIGLTAEQHGVQLPLASWGAGTRRLAALAIAEQNQGEAPITIVDEVERGLEPYRQRSLMESLQAGSSQVFSTTHSPAVISAAPKAGLWYVDHAGQIGLLDPAKTSRHRAHDPEAFLARLTVVAEGATEFGFVSVLLEKTLGAALQQHGIHITDGGGHQSTLDLLEALAAGGLRFAGFADEEGESPTRWQKVGEKLGKLLFRWESGCLDENILQQVPVDTIEVFLTDPDDEKTGMRLRTLADRLKIDDKHFNSIKAAAADDIKSVVLGAMLGTIPDDNLPAPEKKQLKAHAQTWFKSVAGGRELCGKMFSLGLWPAFRPPLLPFCNAIRSAVDLAPIEDLKP